MSETTYYQKNREAILNRARQYCHDNIELLGKKMHEISIENYQKKKKIEKENMGEIDIIEGLIKLDKNAKKIQLE